jgi:hypothetical protein
VSWRREARDSLVAEHETGTRRKPSSDGTLFRGQQSAESTNSSWQPAHAGETNRGSCSQIMHSSTSPPRLFKSHLIFSTGKTLEMEERATASIKKMVGIDVDHGKIE